MHEMKSLYLLTNRIHLSILRYTEDKVTTVKWRPEVYLSSYSLESLVEVHNCFSNQLNSSEIYLLISFGKSLFKPLTIWDQLFITTVSEYQQPVAKFIIADWGINSTLYRSQLQYIPLSGTMNLATDFFPARWWESNNHATSTRSIL